MTPAAQVVLAFGSVAVLLGVITAVRHVAAAWTIGAEVQRKLVHIATGLYALTLPWLFPDRWPVYMLVVLTLGVMLLLRLPGSRLGTTLHGVQRTSYGDFLLAIAVGLCLFFADDALYLYVLPIAVLTLADAAAALAGSTYGTRLFRVEDGQKSVEGSVVFFVVTLLISIICLMLMTPLAAPNILLLSVLVAAFGTLVEADSWRGFDNLFLPMGLLIFLAAHSASSMPELATLAAIFLLSSLATHALAPRLGLSAHAGRVYLVAVFLLLSVTALQNTVAPILVLAAHAWSRSAAPCTARFPDLDIVAALALVSFGWLALGNATTWNAISFYGVAASGMFIALSALALAPRPLPERAGQLLAIGLGLCLLRAHVLWLNPEATNWNGPMWTLFAASLLLAALPPALLPRAFAKARVAKVTLLSLVLPLSAYLAAADLTGGAA
ncbi:MAG: hypothetical protein AAGB05_13290 [Pseudomonadota bacterium]